MVRINLLPPEIGEKRKFERQFSWVILVGILIFVLIGLVWVFLQWQVSQRNGELQSNLETSNQVRTQAEAFKIFEMKENDLATRRATNERALAARVEWARLANELSLVLPSEAWLTALAATEIEGLTITGQIIDSPDDVPDAGHKAVAKLLFRLADLELLENVWLSSSSKTMDSASETPIIEFDVTSAVVKPAAPVTTPSVPAPPATSAQ